MRKRKKLSRGQKAVRNFVLLALVLFGCWGGIRSPLWMMEYELRQDAQEEFEVLWKGSLSGGVYGGGLSSNRPMVVAQVDGKLKGCALSVYEGRYWFYGLDSNLPVEPGIPSVVTSLELANFAGSTYSSLYLMAASLSDETKMGEITVQTQDGSDYTVFGQREMDVIWFPLSVDSEQTYNHLINAAYTLNLYDADGMLLSQTQGVLHEQKEAGT